MQDLQESASTAVDADAEVLAAVPGAIAHFSLDTLFERPVQAELITALLAPSNRDGFTSCVLVHGMGGTGKVSGPAI